MSASWPTTVATNSTLYVAVNELQNNLSGAINAAVTTIGLNSTTGFPTVGLILIDNEVIQYTNISGNSLTGCTRAFDSTSAASHSSAAIVSFAFCAAHHNNLKDEIIAVETSLNLTASRAIATNSSGRLVASAVTDATLAFLDATSSVQTQLNTKLSSNAVVPAADGAVNAPGLTFAGELGSGVYRIGAGDMGVAALGVKAVEIKATGVVNATNYTPFAFFGGPGNKVTAMDKQSTISVAAVATTILTITGDGGLVIVYGKQTTGGGAEFFDVVAIANSTASAIVSVSASGSPGVRTYTAAGGALKVALASGTYTVSASGLSLQG